MVEDEKTNDLIIWADIGDLFTVTNNEEFSRKVLPLYFKHCNWSSFVRQLNMYDFHKINEPNGQDSENQRWDFKHPSFYRWGKDNLHKIRRKQPRSKMKAQIRFSKTMELIPKTNVAELQRNESTFPRQCTMNHDEVIAELKERAITLENKLENTLLEVEYLKKVSHSQQEMLNNLFDGVNYLNSKNESSNSGMETPRKPRKIHELLETNNLDTPFHIDTGIIHTKRGHYQKPL
ncbi:HSF-type DNA-binding-domain-containing protein [Pilobolus umbonatus]|nr:HSF-type DNA-binding-domain-containing protein [Pilobolus umbonatus]